MGTAWLVAVRVSETTSLVGCAHTRGRHIPADARAPVTMVRMELPKMKEKPRKREAKPAHVFITSTLKMMRYLQVGGHEAGAAVRSLLERCREP